MRVKWAPAIAGVNFFGEEGRGGFRFLVPGGGLSLSISAIICWVSRRWWWWRESECRVWSFAMSEKKVTCAFSEWGVQRQTAKSLVTAEGFLRVM